MIVVAGGTGTLGSLLIPRLAEQGLAVRVLTRDPARAAHLAVRGLEVVRADVRDPGSVTRGLDGARTVISAIHGFSGSGDVSPASVDEAGNIRLINAAARNGAAFVLVSVVGAAPSHPMGLMRAKHAAEEALRRAGIPWTIVRATAFTETWGQILGGLLRAAGRIVVFGRGDNPVNFVSATDVAVLLARAVTDASLRDRVLELGGPDNLTFNQFAVVLQEVTGRRGPVRHVPRPVLRVIARTAAAASPSLARQARAALVMDTTPMTFDQGPVRREFPDLAITDVRAALKQMLARMSLPPDQRPLRSGSRSGAGHR